MSLFSSPYDEQVGEISRSNDIFIISVSFFMLSRGINGGMIATLNIIFYIVSYNLFDPLRKY